MVKYYSKWSNIIVTALYAGLLASIPSSHLRRLIIPDDVLIQFDLLMMSAVMLETCRDIK